MHKARDTRIYPQDKDVLKFSLTDNGEFSSKAYMNFLRPPGCKRSLAEIVWHSFLPPNVSTFLWKLIRHALPVDIRIATKGIHLASKCRCCKVLEIETIPHIFLHSEIAREVWRCFEEIFRLPTHFSSIGQLLNIWCPKVGKLSQYEACRVAVAAFCLWNIWAARCAATFEGTAMKARQICLRAISQTQLLSITFSPKRSSSPLHTNIIGILGVQTKPVAVKQGTWCIWTRPNAATYKLNIDGSARNGIITGGGIIRDAGGHFVAAFSAFYGHGTITST